MDKETCDRIVNSNVFVCLLNPDFPGSEGEESLAFAVELGKPVFLWRTNGRSDLPIPPVLDGYHDLHLHDGDVETFVAKLKDFMEIIDGRAVRITS